jgi:sugar phosphate isomerase/epimerase
MIREDFPDFGLLYDLSHMLLLHENAHEALLQLKNHIVHIHVGNCVLDPALVIAGAKRAWQEAWSLA